MVRFVKFVKFVHQNPDPSPQYKEVRNHATRIVLHARWSDKSYGSCQRKFVQPNSDAGTGAARVRVTSLGSMIVVRL